MSAPLADPDARSSRLVLTPSGGAHDSSTRVHPRVRLFHRRRTSTPPADGLRDSFAQQLASNKFVSGFERSGDNMTFKAPRPDGTPSIWRVHIDTATVQAQSNEKQPFKGTIAASWYVNGEQIVITGNDSESAHRADVERPRPGVLGVLGPDSQAGVGSSARHASTVPSRTRLR